MIRVIIRVDGGIASVDKCPADVEVVIRDYDIEGASEDEISQDDNGDDCYEKIETGPIGAI